MKNFIKMALALVTIVITASVKAPPAPGTAQSTAISSSGVHHGGVWHTLQELEVSAHQTPKIQILEHIPEPAPAQLAEPEAKPKKPAPGSHYKLLQCTTGTVVIENDEWNQLEENALTTLATTQEVLEKKCKDKGLGAPQKVVSVTRGVRAPTHNSNQIWPPKFELPS